MPIQGKSGRTLREEKLEDIELLFINMHHLINELRPHQARDNLKAILEIQHQQRIDIKSKFEKHLGRIVDLLRTSIESIGPSVDHSEMEKYVNELQSLIAKSKQLLKADERENRVDPTRTCPTPTDFDKDKILCEIVDEFLVTSSVA